MEAARKKLEEDHASQVAKLKEQIAELEAQIKALQGAIADLQETVKEREATIQSIHDRVAAAERKCEESMAEH